MDRGREGVRSARDTFHVCEEGVVETGVDITLSL